MGINEQSLIKTMAKAYTGSELASDHVLFRMRRVLKALVRELPTNFDNDDPWVEAGYYNQLKDSEVCT